MLHTTNYADAFIEVADDCKADAGMTPPEKEPRTLARVQFDLAMNSPYTFTSDEIIFACYLEKNPVADRDSEERRRDFFAKGQPCLRSSPLGKTYGWGIHFDAAGRVALYGRETEAYEKLKADAGIKHLKAMKSRR